MFTNDGWWRLTIHKVGLIDFNEIIPVGSLVLVDLAQDDGEILHDGMEGSIKASLFALHENYALFLVSGLLETSEDSRVGRTAKFFHLPEGRDYLGSGSRACTDVRCETSYVPVLKGVTLILY